MPIGCRVTLRGVHMFEFLDRLVNSALPRTRDFRGVSSKFNGRGDYNLGLREQYIFPEIEFDKIDAPRGMNITFVTTATNDEEGRELLSLFGMPFRK
jgi:large subunit ribosomal protein L5